jgi:Ran GTPase-activating protein (RanGAP) involved in mRNA processing and transport
MDEQRLLEQQLRIATWRRTRVLDLHGRGVLSSAPNASLLLRAVRDCGGVLRLDLSSTRLGDDALCALTSGGIGAGGTLQHLLLGQTRLTDRAARALAGWLAAADAGALETLALDRVRFASLGVIDLCGALAAHASLRTLSLEGVPLDVDAARALGGALERNFALRSLHLGSCELVPTSLAPVCAALSDGRNGTLRELTLSDNRLGPHGVTLVMAMCVANDSLRVLRLCNADLDDAALALVVDRLPQCDRLTHLCLEANRYSFDAAARLVDHVVRGSASALTTLSLDHERALADGGQLGALTAALVRNAERLPPLGAPLSV